MQCCSIRGFRWIYVSGYAAACMAACMHHARMMHSMHCTQTCTYAPCKRCGCPHLHGCYAVVALHYCCVLLVLQVCRLLLGKEISAVCTVSKSVNTRALMRSECSDASWGPQYANTSQYEAVNIECFRCAAADDAGLEVRLSLRTRKR